MLRFTPRRRPAAAGDEDAEAFLRQVHDALSHLDDPAHLQVHPLAAGPSPPRARSSRAGAALRAALLDAIEALRPGPGADPASHGWRGYHLLRRRYVEGATPAAVQRQLGIGQSEYYRDHRRALVALAALLRERGAPAPVADAPAPRQVGPALWGDPAGGPPRQTTPGALPLALTSFIGRERELGAVVGLLNQARLVTLVGPPGAGKTRLAVEAARAAVAAFPDGVRFVPLAEARAGSDVPSALARALGVEPAGDAGGALRVALGERRLLLLLDNCEHVLPATAPLAAELLAAAPGLAVLATSRAPLGIAGEREVPLPPLALPDAAAPSPATLAGVEAVRLFVDRARAAWPPFALDAGNAAAVAALCRRLDGLPLAIELAAARTRALSPAELLARLDRRLPLLASGPGHLPERQRTLRAAIAWSDALLAPAERRLFRRLAVFVGAFPFEAAEAVGAGGEGEMAGVLDGVEALVAQSLVQREAGPGGAARFRLLETIREYALEGLEASGEAAAARRDHLAYHVALVERARGARDAAELGRRLDRLEGAYPDLREALRRAEAAGEAESALRLATGLLDLWLHRGPRDEGRDWLERAAALPDGAPAARAGALAALVELAFTSLDPRAPEYAAAALALAQESGDPVAVAGALLARVAAEHARGGEADAVEAARWCAQARALYRAAGDRSGVARSLIWEGRLALEHRGDVAAAGPLLDQAIALFRQGGHPYGLASSLVVAGRVARQRGDGDLARRRFAEALAQAEALGSRQLAMFAELTLGMLALGDGDLAQARASYAHVVALRREMGGLGGTGLASAYRMLATAEARDGARTAAADHFAASLRLAMDGGHREAAGWALEGLAALAAARGEPARALRLAGAAATVSGPRWRTAPPEQALLEGARRALGEGAAADWAAGQALPLDEAVAEALTAAEDAPASPSGRS